MSFSEQRNWVYAVTAIIFPIGYVVAIAGELQRTSAVDVAYQVPLLGAIAGAAIVALIAHVAMAVATPADGRTADERDRAIDRHGEVAASVALTVGMLGVLALVLLEIEHLWIASAMYLVFALSGCIGAVAKVVAYRRGLPTW